MAATCVYCNSQENLNAQFTITIDDGTKVVVHICDLHADDASIRTAKEKYLEKRQKLQDLMAQAKELGFEISAPAPSGLVVATKVQPVIVEQKTTVAPAVTDDQNMIDTTVMDRRKRAMPSIAGQVSTGQSIESHQSLDNTGILEQLPEDALEGKVLMEVVEGRSGMPVAIPTKRVDKLGTTQIRLVPTTDQELQSRFKATAAEGFNSHQYGRDGYAIVNCPICHGIGEAKNAGKMIVCPKCKGKGTLN